MRSILKINEIDNKKEGSDLTSNAVSLFNFMRSFESTSIFIDTCIGDGFLYIPSIFSNYRSVCIANEIGSNISKLGVYNFLCFIDNEKAFVVIQHHNFISVVFLIDIYSDNLDILHVKSKGLLAITNQSIFIHNEKIVIDEFFKVANIFRSKKSNTPKKVEYYIDGYQRPYHYFYDRLPWLIDFLKVSEIKSILSVLNSRFLSFKKYEYLEASLIDNNKLGVVASEVGRGKDKTRLAEIITDEFLENELEHFECLIDNKKSFEIVLWIGLCEEKRSWLEKKETIINFIRMLNEEKVSYHVFFDGMTKPVNTLDNVNYGILCNKEVLLLESILESVDVLSFCSLINATSHEKINAARLTDYYFTSALTDSMWCSHFFRKPGAVYLAVPGTDFQHSHPKSYFIPSDKITTINDSDNWARKGMSINSDYVSNLLLKDVVFLIKLKGLFKKGLYPKVTQNDSSSLYIVSEDSFVSSTVFQCNIPNKKSYFSLGYSTPGFSYSEEIDQINADYIYIGLDAVTEGTSSMHLYIVLFSENGERIEHFSVSAGNKGFFKLSEKSKRIRIFYRFSGVGLISFYGIRCIPI